MNNERYKQLMNDVGLPNSLSLLTALRQVENEVSQPLLAENERLKSLLTDWQEFATDVSAADCGGQDWLDELRGRTKAALEQKLCS
jgi:hypothetical protein